MWGVGLTKGPGMNKLKACPVSATAFTFVENHAMVYGNVHGRLTSSRRRDIIIVRLNKT